MNVLIIEDENRNANRLVRLLHEIEPTAQVSGPATSITEAVQMLTAESQPDLVLADIQLTDGLSFEALRQTDCQAPVIFTTAYDEYAIQAFKFNSLDYLLKPINAEELKQAIDKVKRITPTSVPPLAQLLEAMKASQYQYRERFLVPFRDEFLMVPVSAINHVFTENRKVFLRLNDGTQHTVGTSMDELERQLNPQHFFRPIASILLLSIACAASLPTLVASSWLR